MKKLNQTASLGQTIPNIFFCSFIRNRTILLNLRLFSSSPGSNVRFDTQISVRVTSVPINMSLSKLRERSFERLFIASAKPVFQKRLILRRSAITSHGLVLLMQFQILYHIINLNQLQLIYIYQQSTLLLFGNFHGCLKQVCIMKAVMYSNGYPFEQIDFTLYSDHDISSIYSGEQYFMISSKRQDRLKEKEYILKQKIGSGSFGDVQKCESVENGKIYAVKSIPVNRLYVDAIEEQANNMLKSNSQYVIELVDHFYDQNLAAYVLVTPYYRMGSFQTLMNKEWKIDELLLFFYQIAKALYDLSLHSILHLDIKPENILIQAPGQYIVCDLGCSRKMENQTNMWMSFNALKVSTTMRGGGTTEYASADLVLTTEMTPFSDIWSLGIILYKIIYKKHPLMIIPSQYNNRLDNFQKGKISIQYPETQKFQELYPVVDIIKNMLVPSKDKSKRIGWDQILQRICKTAKIPTIKRAFIITNFDILLQYTDKVTIILAAVLHYHNQCKQLLTDNGIQIKNLINYSCIYLLSLTKEVITHTNSQIQDFWQFHLFQTTQKLLTKKQKSNAQILQKQAIALATEYSISIEYGNLSIVRQKLVYEYGKVLKPLKKMTPPSSAMQRADFKKLVSIIQFIFMVSKLQYSERKKLKVFVDGLINS